jgi:hypothetical protein
LVAAKYFSFGFCIVRIEFDSYQVYVGVICSVKSLHLGMIL